MDKEPTQMAIWIWGVLGSVAGFLGIRIRWWLLFVTLPLPLMFFLGMFMELSDEYVGAAIRVEGGDKYIVSVYLSFVLMVLGHVLGYFSDKRGPTDGS